MTTFSQAQDTRRSPATFANITNGTVAPTPQFPDIQGFVTQRPSGGPVTAVDQKTAPQRTQRNGSEVFKSSGGFYWFERFHVIPRAFDFGNLLSSQSIPIEVFSAFRNDVHAWTSFVNGAGAGTELGGIPSLPTDVDPLSGVQMTVDVSTSGDPFVDATLDFVFAGVGTVMVPIVIQRIVLYGARPEQEYTEILSFLTNVYPSKDGTEKRESVRNSPRQRWEYDYLIDEGVEAQTLENLLFDFQSLAFGVPVWFDETTLEVTAAPGTTVITVASTDFRDFRIGGLAVLVTSQSVFDVLEISAITSTTITFTSPTVNSYNEGTLVYPLAPSYLQPDVRGSRWADNLQRQKISFEPIDNDAELADLSAFSSYKGKLLLDNGNSIRGTVPHSYRVELARIDGGSGLRYQSSAWDRSKRSHLFTLYADGREAVFNMRRMIYALRGRFTSFYVPRDSDDLVPVADLLIASNTFDVTNVGYAQFVRNRQPKSDIRISFVDGSTPVLRGISASSSPSATVDQLTVDNNWAATYTPAEISRIEYVEKVRFATDSMKIKYDRAGLRARLEAPVVALFE